MGAPTWADPLGVCSARSSESHLAIVSTMHYPISDETSEQLVFVLISGMNLGRNVGNHIKRKQIYLTYVNADSNDWRVQHRL